ncbi:FmdE family protein [Meiothermus sp.]|uniref:FmdE family protein n=1 Tax=Meiothermus sp. TaxID=1955249 RepID=UPI00307EA379
MIKETPVITEEMVQGAVAFHGHLCPGLAMGIRAAEVALREVGRATEEWEVAAQVETDMCAVDAIQYLVGCTFGRGTLMHLDYGKNAYTFTSRADGKTVRIVSKASAGGPMSEEHQALWQKLRDKTLTPEDKKRFWQLQNARARVILDAPLESLYEFTQPPAVPPRRNGAPLYTRCESCGESVAQNKTRTVDAKTLCVPCATKAEQGA